jgi:hypothetical protein
MTRLLICALLGIVWLVGSAPAEEKLKIEGSLKEVKTAEGLIVVQVGDSEKKLIVGASCKITGVPPIREKGKKGGVKEPDINSLRPGLNVTVVFTKDDVAEEIAVSGFRRK